MRHLPLLIGLLIVLGVPTGAPANDKDIKSPKPVPVSTRYQKPYSVPKKQWLEEFAKQFGSEVCSEESKLRKCAELKASDCQGNLRDRVIECSKVVKVPARVTSSLQNYKVGREMGACLGERVFGQRKVARECLIRERR